MAHVNLSVILHLLGPGSISPLSFLFSRIQKDPNGLNCPSPSTCALRLIQHSQVSIDTATGGSSHAAPVRRIFSRQVDEQDPWMVVLSETWEAKKRSAWKSLYFCAQEWECKYCVKNLYLTPVISAKGRRRRRRRLS